MSWWLAALRTISSRDCVPVWPWIWSGSGSGLRSPPLMFWLGKRRLVLLKATLSALLRFPAALSLGSRVFTLHRERERERREGPEAAEREEEGRRGGGSDWTAIFVCLERISFFFFLFLFHKKAEGNSSERSEETQLCSKRGFPWNNCKRKKYIYTYTHPAPLNRSLVRKNL